MLLLKGYFLGKIALGKYVKIKFSLCESDKNLVSVLNIIWLIDFLLVYCPKDGYQGTFSRLDSVYIINALWIGMWVNDI